MAMKSIGWRVLLGLALGLGGVGVVVGDGGYARGANVALVVAETEHLFRFDARGVSPKPVRVRVAGSFTKWKEEAEDMRDEGNGFWSLKRTLPDGVHFYKFIINDDTWVNDPNDDKELREDDGNGGQNSAVLVGPDARKWPAPVAGAVNKEAVRFNPADLADFNVVSETVAQVSMRTQIADVDSVNVLVAGPAGQMMKYPLYRGDKGMGLERYSAVVPISSRPMKFEFELVDAGKSFYVTPGGLKASADVSDGFSSEAKLTFATPEWSKQAVWYQIFVERFRNGDKANDPGDKNGERLIPWTADWWKTQANETPGEENFYKGQGNVWRRRYGGDIQGVREKLPYLRSLGVTAIYLNPVFAASSMHKYDTRDYRHIDPNFSVKEAPPAGETDDPATWKWSAGDKLFLDFVAEAHRQGFKVVLDGVFNHVGRDHVFFQDVMQKGKASKYAGWFDITKFADSYPTTEELLNKPGGMYYKSWDGNGSLPNLKKDAKTGLAAGPYEHVMAVTKRWLAPDGDASRGIDGWRLDVANDIPHPFWVEWRKTVKGAKADAYISGEIWSPAQEWLRGDQFDGVMNYQFAMAAQKFFVNTSTPFQSTPTQFEKDLWRLTTMYPLQAAEAMMNLYDSHDTDRMASMFVNPNLVYDQKNRIQDNGPGYSARKPNAAEWERIKQMARFQMTFIGSPMVYYGNEAGMWSPDDPSNREPMTWKDLEPYENADVKFDEGVFKTYQHAIAVRIALPALQRGYFHSLVSDDARGVVAFARDLGDKSVIVVINRSAKDVTMAVPVPGGAKAAGAKLVDWMSEEDVSVVDEDASMTARPMARVKAGSAGKVVKADGSVEITVKPWGVMVLAEGAR